MQTHFNATQKADAALKRADAALRKCVHCGFCNATCPTFLLTGNELEGPRGRITLIQDLLESEAAPSLSVINSLDHCLSCLNCESTCPSGISYRHLIDPARERIEQSGRRPFWQSLKRAWLAWLLPNARYFRRAVQLAQLSRPLLSPVAHFCQSAKLFNALLPKQLPHSSGQVTPGFYPAEGKEIKRVALIPGCVQRVLNPDIDAATVRVLTRHGCAVVVPKTSKAGCCGALPYHLGKKTQAVAMAHQNLAIWESLVSGEAGEENTDHPVDAVLMTATGCGSMLKDYPDLLPDEAHTKLLAKGVKDLSQVLADLPLKTDQGPGVHSGEPITLAWQCPCSLQHGLKEQQAPITVLESCGFIVKQPKDPHLCCGSAGTYNLLQPEAAARLGINKAKALLDTTPDIIVSANIGCMTQLSVCTDPENTAPSEPGDNENPVPVLHLAQIVDWATGGPDPTRPAKR